MAKILKVSVLEEDQVEFGVNTEALLSIQNVHNQSNDNLDVQGQDLESALSFIRKNGLYRRDFGNEKITVPSRHVMQMHSPVVDGEVIVDGEVYIL